MENTGKLEEILNKLPKFGHIACEKSSGFWSINLGDSWNSKSGAIVELCKELYNDKKIFQNSTILGNKWFHLVSKNTDKKSPKVHFTSRLVRFQKILNVSKKKMSKNGCFLFFL